MVKDFESVKKIHFVGIGGIGMSATAGIAMAKGFNVSGSDSAVYGPSKSVLKGLGIKYSLGYSGENVKGADIVVVTSAETSSNPEITRAQELGIPVVGFPELLGRLAQNKYRIVVSGTHGKGTTAGLISYALKELADDSFFVGGVLINFGTSFYYGSGGHFILEGDEYKSTSKDPTPKFEFYKPDLLLINNIEFDHPDTFHDIKSVKQAFSNLLKHMPASGTVIYNADDPNVVDVVSGCIPRKIGFGFDSSFANVLADRPALEGGNSAFSVSVLDSGANFKVRTHLPGMPYAYDILAGVSVLLALGYKPEQFSYLIPGYKGLLRRYETVYGGALTIIDDYAHHPTAVKQTLEAIRQKYPGRRIVCFFEPHTFSRTRETLPQLKDSFESADLVYIAEVDPAREKNSSSRITGQEVAAEVGKNHRNVAYVRNGAEALSKFLQDAKVGDVVVVMAVGSFSSLAEDFKKHAISIA